MTDAANRKITLKARPEGYPKLSDFGLVEEAVPQPREGEVLAGRSQTRYNSTSIASGYGG